MGEPHLHIVVSPEGEGSVVIMALLEELTRGTVSGKQNRAVAIGFQNPDGIQPYYLTVNGLSEPAHRQNIFRQLVYFHVRGIMTTNSTCIRGDKREKLAQSSGWATSVSNHFWRFGRGNVMETLGNHW